MQIILLARFDTKEQWSPISNPQPEEIDVARTFLFNELNEYLEFKNCGVIYRFIRVKQLKEYTLL